MKIQELPLCAPIASIGFKRAHTKIRLTIATKAYKNLKTQSF
jgi:hypothetical protein